MLEGKGAGVGSVSLIMFTRERMDIYICQSVWRLQLTLLHRDGTASGCDRKAGGLAQNPRRRVCTAKKKQKKNTSNSSRAHSSRRRPGWAWQGAATSWVHGWGSGPRDHCVLVHLWRRAEVSGGGTPRGTFDSTRARALAFIRPFAIRAISVGW